jgi:predicted 3-demethylubiquinone-9 3-methyltransferase (glyoxalase superfamily)
VTLPRNGDTIDKLLLELETFHIVHGSCDDQAEIDRLWAALSEGGKIEQCGWLKDRYGLFRQIAPTVLGDKIGLAPSALPKQC